MWVTPGNGGTEDLDDCKSLAVGEQDAEGLIKACQEQVIDLVVIGPEAPLAAGVADRLRQAGLAVFGPSADGAQLEASKAWAKDLMREAKIPTAGHWTVASASEGLELLQELVPLMFLRFSAKAGAAGGAAGGVEQGVAAGGRARGEGI